MNKGCNVFYFVALLVTNIMPAYIFGKLPVFINQFLHIILTKITLPQVVQFKNIICRFGFGNGNQCGLAI